MDTIIKLDIPADAKYLSVLGAAVSAFAELAGDSTITYAVQLAVHEICANIIDHAYGAYDPDNRIDIRLTLNEAQLAAKIVDNGRVFNPQTLLETTWEMQAAENGSSYRLTHINEPRLEQERGRGIYLVYQLMDSVIYTPQNDRNLWQLTRNLFVE